MPRSVSERAWTTAGLATALVLASGSLGLSAVYSAMASRSSLALIKCAEARADILPVSRAVICLCFVEKTHTLVWAMFRIFSPATTEVRAERVAFNGCAASDFASNQPGDGTAKPLDRTQSPVPPAP
jgi:hypothetical protein